jgi:PAS domain S-box-containing protein
MAVAAECGCVREGTPPARVNDAMTTSYDEQPGAQAWASLMQSNGFVRQVADLMPVVLAILDVATERYVYTSPNVHGLTGYTPDEITSMSEPFTLWHPDDVPVVREHLERLKRLADGQITQAAYRVRHRDGYWQWLSSRSTPFARDDSGAVRQVVTATRDITEWKHAEEALQLAREELERRVVERTEALSRANQELRSEIADRQRAEAQLLADAAERQRSEERLRRSEAYLAEGQRLTHTGSWGWKFTTGEMFWSHEQFRIFGLSPDEPPPLIGGTLDRMHPDDRAFVRQNLAKMVRQQKDQEWECRIIARDGTVRHVHTTAHPVFDANGNLVEYVGTTMDRSEQKRAAEALQKMQAELAHMTRVSVMGELTSSIAHETNQPLAAMAVNANAALRWLDREPANLGEVKAALERITEDAQRASEIIARIRGMLVRKQAPKVPLQLAEVVGEVVAMLTHAASERSVPIATEVAPDLATVIADRVQLQQVMINLAMNAMDAMAAVPAGTRNLLLTAANYGEAEVRVAIHDTGKGVPAAHRQRIFEPFFTTKREGMGMGLAISRSIVEAHGGRIWATPYRGGGETFQFTLPVA